MKPLEAFASRAVPLPRPDIDTDQIIPARYATFTDAKRLRQGLFRNWRDEEPECPLNQTEMGGRSIIVAGPNFGCGSSRESAVWALAAGGFRAVISTGFGDIFAQNAMKNGLLPIAIDQAAADSLWEALRADPGLTLSVDLAAGRVSCAAPPIEIAFALEPFATRLLLEGRDELDYLLGMSERIAAYERGRDTA